MAFFSKVRYRLRKHHKQFTKDLPSALDDSEKSADNTNHNKKIRLSILQQGYQWLTRRLTLSFFGNIEGILIIILLALLPWQKLYASDSYTVYSALLGIISFTYLRYLSKRQRVSPNHPYLCAAMVSFGFYALQVSGGIAVSPMIAQAKTSSPTRWLPLILLSCIVRSQFPSFLRIDWSQTIPSCLVFNRFKVLEETAVKALSIISVLTATAGLLLGNIEPFKSMPIISSTLCILLYTWLIINADMDTPVMTVRAKILTTVMSIGALAIILYLPKNSISGFDWIMSVGVTISMSWYWVYGGSQRYFDRWHAAKVVKTLPSIVQK